MSVLDKGGMVALDPECAVWYDSAQQVLYVDGVRMSLSHLVHLVNPDPSKYFRSQRDGDNVTVTQYTRGALMAELGVKRPEIDKMAHALAYEHALAEIESNCLALDDSAECFDLDDVDELAAEDVAECVKYLEARGLIEHDDRNPLWICIRNESEETA